jgi:translation initiation factor 4G
MGQQPYMTSPGRPAYRHPLSSPASTSLPQTPPRKGIVIRDPKTGEEVQLEKKIATPSSASTPDTPSRKPSSPATPLIISKPVVKKDDSEKIDLEHETTKVEEVESSNKEAVPEQESEIADQEESGKDESKPEVAVDEKMCSESEDLSKETHERDDLAPEQQQTNEDTEITQEVTSAIESADVSENDSEKPNTTTSQESPEAEELEDADTIISDEDVSTEGEPKSLSESARPKRTVYLLTTELDSVTYPEHIATVAPKAASKFVYSREFLMHFQDLCTEKPSEMGSLDSIFCDDSPNAGGRAGSSGNFNRRSGSRGQSGVMGQIGQERIRNVPRTSEERLAQYYQRKDGDRSGMSRSNSSSGSVPTPGAKMHRLSSGGRQFSGGHGMGPRHNRGSTGRGKQSHISNEPPVKLETTENRWVPHSAQKNDKAAEKEVEELDELERKIKGLLNKLTLEKFQKLSTQIIDLGTKSSAFLTKTMNLVFDKALDEPNFCVVYAHLCSYCHRVVDREVVTEKEGKTQNVKVGEFFRAALLTRCQKEFEEGPKWDESVASDSNMQMLTDEYYVQAKAKRHGLGLVKFIGELFKEGMLTDKIMARCISTFMAASSKDALPSEEKIESVCKLLSTVGVRMERSSGQFLDSIFHALTSLAAAEGFPKRIKFLIMVMFFLPLFTIFIEFY